MIDTHTHIYMPEFDAEGAPYAGQCAAVDRAIAAGVDIMIFPNVDRATVEPMIAVNSLRTGSTRLAMGLHPTEVKENWRDELTFTTSLIEQEPERYVAVGEVGIDLYWDSTFEREQMQVFDGQLSLAERFALPVIIHCREALPQVLEVLQGHKDVAAVFHSFGGNTADVERIRTLGDHYFGINGIVTFKNSRLATVLPEIGAERLLSETDSPYLAPVPHRGKRNESANIPFIVARMAEALGISTDEMAQITTRNAINFFKLK